MPTDEGDSGSWEAVFAVTLSAPFAFDVGVDWATRDGTAVAGEDYAPQSGHLVIPAGETVGTVAVLVLGDPVYESDETFFVDLSGPVNASIADGTGTATILNDDPLPRLSIAGTEVVEGDLGETEVQLVVTVSPPSDRPIAVDYRTQGTGTAYREIDFADTAGTLAIAAGAAQATIDLVVFGDTLPEGDETVEVTLTNPVHAAIEVSEATVAILEDDGECVGANLIRNPGGEEPVRISGVIPHWEPAEGGPWTLRGGNSPYSVEGGVSLATADYFADIHELRQEVDLTPLAAEIATGGQLFVFEGYVRSLNDAPAELIVEYLDGAGAVLATLANPPVVNSFHWERATHTIAIPVGTASARIRLRSAPDVRKTGALFDALSLRPIGVPTLSAADVRVIEGVDTQATVTVVLSCPSGVPVTVDYATADGTALAGSDYLATSGSVTFAPGEVTAEVAVEIIDDTANEGEEEFLLQLANPVGAPLARTDATVTIVDDDLYWPLPRASLAWAQATEGDAGVQAMAFTVTLDRPGDLPVTATISTVDESAVAGVDYQPLSGTLTIPPGETSAVLEVGIIGDEEVEGNESFLLELRGVTNALVGYPYYLWARGTVLDDDGEVTLRIHYEVARLEGDQGLEDMVFPVTLSRAVWDADVTVDFATVDGTAIAGEDYVATSGTLTIPAGQTAAEIRVPVVGDERWEPVYGDERFTVELSEVVPSSVEIVGGVAVGRIVDDDQFVERFAGTFAGGMTFIGNTLGLSKGSATDPWIRHSIGAFTSTDPSLQVDPYPAGTTLDWQENGSAAMLDLPAGAEVVHAELIWSALYNQSSHPVETPVTLEVPSGASHSVAPEAWTDRHRNDNTYVHAAEVTDLVAAGGSGRYAVHDLPAAVGGDYSDFAGWTLAVFYRDPAQPLRTFSLHTGLLYCSAGDRYRFAIDVPERRPLVGRLAASAGEGDANEGDAIRILHPDAINYAYNYYRLSGPNNPVDNFFTSQINDDAGLLETRGTFGDRNHSAGTLTVQGRQGWDITNVDISHVLEPGQQQALARIACDAYVNALGFQVDTTSVVFPTDVKSVDRSFVRVGDRLTYTVELRNDGTVAAQQIEFRDALPPGLAFVAGSFTVGGVPVPGADPQAGVPLADIAAGGRTVVSFEAEVLPLAELPPEYRNRAEWTYRYREAADQPWQLAGVTTNEVVTYNEDVVVVAIDDVTVTEDDAGAVEALFTVRLPSPLGRTVRFGYETVDGTAVAGTDFTATSGTLTFLSGELEKTIRVPIAGDLVPEFEETFTVSLTSPDGVPIGKDTGTCTIVDNDPALLVVSDASELEGDATARRLVFTVSHNNVTGQAVAVDVATADGTAVAGGDYLPVAKTLFFPPGVASLDVAVTTVPDLVNEPHETVSLILSRPGNAVLGDGEGVGTILNDDGPLGVSIADAPTFEGDEGTSPALFAISIPFPVPHDVSVAWATADGTAVAGVDYEAASGIATIPAGETTTVVSVDVFGDTVQSPERTFFVNLSDPQPVHNVTLADPQGIGRILDDEPTPQILVQGVEVVEGDAGSVDAVFEVAVTGEHYLEMAVDYETFNGSARAGTDFTETVGRLTFAPGETLRTITVPVSGDTEDETDEHFYLRLTHPANAFLAVGTAQGWIRDDDDDGTCPGPNLLVNPGAEETPVAGELAGWTEAAGEWNRQDRDPWNPKPVEAFWYFVSGGVPEPELTQTVDLSAYAAAIDGSGVEFVVEGAARARYPAPTFARVAVEYQDGSGAVLDTYDSGQLLGPTVWHELTDRRAAPAGTRAARVRLLCGGNAYNSNCRFDGLVLRPVGVATISAGDVEVVEGDAGTTTAAFPVQLSCALPGEVSATYATRDSGALAGEDFLAAGGTVTLAPGETERSVEVQVLGDEAAEADEEFFLDLSAPVGALPGDGTGRGLIRNDDGPLMDLAICMDTSGSVSAADFQLQLEGLALAVEDPSVISHNGTVRLSAYKFADGAVLDLEPTLITADNFAAVAAAIRAIPRGAGATNMASCIDLATEVIGEQQTVSLKQVIDLSTDGGQTHGDALAAANQAVAQGIDAINAIGIGTGIDEPFLRLMVRPQPPGGPDGFVMLAPSFDAYVLSIQEKIKREVRPNLVVGIDDGVPSAVPGGDLTYEVTVTNTGSGSVTELVLNDFVPVELGNRTFTPSEGVFDPTTAAWTGVLLENGTSLVLTVSGSIDPLARDTLRAEVTASPVAGTFDLDESDNTAAHDTPLQPETDLGIDKALATNLIAGQLATYVLTVTNHGPSWSAGPIEIVDPLPPSLVLLSAAGTGWTCSGNPELRCAHAGPLPVGGVLPPIEVHVRLEPFAQQVVNAATVSGPDPDPVPDNDTALHIAAAEAIPQLFIFDATTNEGDAGALSLAFDITLSPSSSLDVTFDYAAVAGTATAGADYTAATGTVTIPAGSTTATVSVPILGDLLDEPDETFTVELSDPVHATLGDSQAIGTILDDDEPPTVSIGDTSVTEGNVGTSSANFPVSLSAPSGFDITVNYATTGAGPAGVGVDYAAAAGAVTIPAGSTTTTVSVPILGDLLDEPDETFTVELSDPVNATLGASQAIGTILDDDEPPTVAIGDVSVTEGDTGTTDALFAVTLSAPTSFAVSVDFATADGTATAGADYTAQAGTLTIPAGSIAATVAVPVLGDLADEPDETFTVELSRPVNAGLGDGQGLGTILDDDEPLNTDLILTKEFLGDPVPPGGTAQLEFTIQAVGTYDAASELAFTDDLDAALPGLAALGPFDTGSCGGSLTGSAFLAFSGGALSGGECSFQVTVQVPDDVPFTPTVTNTTSEITATIQSVPVTGDPATAQLELTLATFTKSFDGITRPSGTPVVTFAIENLSTLEAATDLSFTDDLETMMPGLVAAGLPAEPCGPGSSATGTSVLTLSAGTVPAGGSCTFDVTLQVPATAVAGTYLNVTSELLSGETPVAAGAAARLIVDPAPFFAKRFVPDLISAGQSTKLAFLLDNTDSAFALEAIDFTDHLPAGVTVAEGTDSGTNCTGGTLTAIDGSGTVSYTGGSLPAGASCVIEVDVESFEPGRYVNVTGELTSSAGSSGTATDVLVVTAPGGPCLAADGEYLTLHDDTILDTREYEVCHTLTVDPNYAVVGPNGELTLRAGVAVVFGNGFAVLPDGRLVVENVPALLP